MFQIFSFNRVPGPFISAIGAYIFNRIKDRHNTSTIWALYFVQKIIKFIHFFLLLFYSFIPFSWILLPLFSQQNVKSSHAGHKHRSIPLLKAFFRQALKANINTVKAKKDFYVYPPFFSLRSFVFDIFLI